jgi:hypothetical protein
MRNVSLLKLKNMKTLSQVFEKAIEIENENAIKFDRVSNSDFYSTNKNGVIYNETGSVIYDQEDEMVSDSVLWDFANED